MASALNTTNSYVNLELSSSQNDNISEGQLKMKHDNPLLCYLVHKMDIINQELLVKVASEFYTDLEAETAKELLFRTVSTGVRNIKRKGSEKCTQNIIDMLGILHKTKEEDIPMFGVFDLTRLPPLDLNFIDVTTLSQDIKQIRSEIKDCEPQVNQQKIEVMSRDIVTMKDNMKLMEKQLTEVLKCLRSAPEGKLGDKNVTPSTLKLPPAMTQKTITPSRKLQICKISTFNCHGFSSSKDELKLLCETSNIICVQEHWLFPEDVSRLNTVHTAFKSVGVSAIDPSSGIVIGRPYGGVAILWHENLDQNVMIVSLEYKWIYGIKVNSSEGPLYIFCVYLPYESYENVDEFVQCLAILQNI